jgi:1-acyl-sn-glycerol-3-phosphate acyltransferase
MEQWHYDPAAYIDAAQPLRRLPRVPAALVTGMRSLAAAAVRGWLQVYHRLTILGRHHLPNDRSFVLVANHASHLDTLCLLSALPLGSLHQAYPAAAKDYFCVSRLRALLARVVVNALPFDRHAAPWQSLSRCSRLLEEPGNILIFFPEGTRSQGSEPGEFKPGVALLTAGRDIPVVPCHLAGTQTALPKGARFPRPTALRLNIGTPRCYAHLPATKESARRICHELRETVISLGRASLPSSIRAYDRNGVSLARCVLTTHGVLSSGR